MVSKALKKIVSNIRDVGEVQATKGTGIDTIASNTFTVLNSCDVNF